jgi:hypothetical protein
VDFDFSGVNRQTTLFHDGVGSGEIHQDNLTRTETFLATEGTPVKGQGNSLVWRDVGVAAVSDFLRDFRFHDASQFFSEIGPFCNGLIAKQ